MKPSFRAANGGGPGRHVRHALLAVLGCAMGLAGTVPMACAPQQMAPQAGGQIYINTDPAGAEITCDLQATPGLSPTTIQNLAAGEYLITASKNGFNDARTTVSLANGARKSINLKLVPVEGLLLIHSTPQGAEVEIDGASLGKTPILNARVPLGRHRLTFQSPGFTTKTIEINLENRTPQMVNINLQTDQAKVRFDSNPAGAEVSIDGVLAGQTPCEIARLASGKHRFSVSHHGYETRSEEFSLAAGEERALNINLTPLPARLAVATTPAKARLFINDQYKGETPFRLDGLAAGRYDIRVELKGYEPLARVATLGPGDEISEEFLLQKNSGSILIYTEPAEVEVILNGEKSGTTKAINHDPISSQLSLDLIASGSHTLQLTKSGYHNIATNVSITGQTLILHFKLTPIPVKFTRNYFIRTGPGPENSFTGMLREQFDNGDVKMELEPGIFRTFKSSEIIAAGKLKTPQE